LSTESPSVLSKFKLIVAVDSSLLKTIGPELFMKAQS